MTDFQVRQLACAVTLQAVKDYFHKRANEEYKQKILKDLRSDWMNTLTNGTSVIVAEQLEKHPDEIKARLPKYNTGREDNSEQNN